jgi:DNA-binding transcriptional LysR family regulator
MTSTLAETAPAAKPESANGAFARLNNTTLDDVASLCVLYAVVTTGSFTRAAQRLGLSKSAVSAKIAAFERATGAQLLNRSPRVVTPTDAGRRLAECAERMLQAGTQGLEELALESRSPSGLLRVTAPVAIGRQLVAPHVPGFLDRFPAVHLHLELTDSVVSLPTHAYDVAIRHTDTPPETYMVWPLRKVRWFVVASPGHLAASGEPREPADLASRNCLFYLRDERQAEWSFARDGRTTTVRVSGRFLANNSEVLRGSIVSGLGIGLLPDYSCTAELESGDLVRVLTDYEVRGTFAESIVAARPWTGRVPLQTRAFVEYLREALGGRDAPAASLNRDAPAGDPAPDGASPCRLGTAAGSC